MKVLTAGLIAAMTLILPSTAEADVRVGVGIRLGDGYNSRDTRRFGFDRGYDEGYREGLKDGRRGERYSFWDEGRYRDSDRGYRHSYGPRWEYREGYKNGFQSGYRRGYQSSRPHYNNRNGWNDGYRDDDRYRR